MSIVLNEARVGNFTSSQIYKLIPMGSRPMTEEELIEHKRLNPSSRKKNIADGFSDPGLTYIEEKKFEKILNRSLDTDAYSRAIAWGEFMEKRVFELIGLEYIITSKETNEHPTIKGWSGSKDLFVPVIKVGEIKGYQLKKFCAYQEALRSKDVQRIRTDFPQEYWQMVSNAIINEVPKAEAILYAPYESEMLAIRAMADEYEEADAWRYKFIYDSANHELPVLPDDSKYDNLVVFEFDVPEEDKELLTRRVKEAIAKRDEIVKETVNDLEGVL